MEVAISQIKLPYHQSFLPKNGLKAKRKTALNFLATERKGKAERTPKGIK